jgi:ABC-type nitrate/sulfonate/bicarbonate transport system permease component
MSNVGQTLDARAGTSSPLWLRGLQQAVWTNGLLAAAAWAAAALITIGLPDVVPWGSAGLFAALTGSGAAILLVLSFFVHRLGRATAALLHYGPWLVAVGIWLALWELTTAKFGWLPKPFFSPPHGLLHVYVAEAPRLLICIGYTMRLWSLGFVAGIAVGYVLGVALGWSKSFSYWGMPILKLIGPVPATAMGLYYSFAVLVVAEMLGAKYGLGWYIQFQTAYSGYANVYATLIIMSLICAGLVKLLFVVRDRLLGWQRGFI